MNVELVTARDAVPSLAKRWDELAGLDARDGFFRTSAWYMAWMEHIRKDAEPFILVVRDGDGEMVGLAPLCQVVYRDLGFGLSAVAWGGREVVSGDFLDVVSMPGKRMEVAAAVFEFLRNAQSKWGLLVLGELMDGGDSCRALDQMAEEAGLPVRRQEERICPYIALPGTFDEYLGGLGSSTRYHIRRRMRDIEKLQCRIQRYTEPGDLQTHLDTLIRLHLARWRHENLPGTLGRPGFAGFLRQICANPPAGSGVRLYELTCEGSPAAALLAFHFGESALYYQAGWDPDSPFAAHSPGVVLMAHSIRDAIESGLRYYEFLRGEEAYKSRWTTTYRKSVTVLAARSAGARQYLRLARLKDLVKHGSGDPEPKQTPSAARAARSG